MNDSEKGESSGYPENRRGGLQSPVNEVGEQAAKDHGRDHEARGKDFEGVIASEGCMGEVRRLGAEPGDDLIHENQSHASEHGQKTRRDGGPVAPRKLPTIMQEDVRVTMYELIMRVALADGVVHSAEREFLAKYQMENAITDAEHVASLEANGWTAAQWDAGVQEGQLEGGTAAIKSAIPDLLTQAGIKSRLTDGRGKDKK